MKPVFIDTSAFFALLDADDAGHPEVKVAWLKLLETNALLVTSNYILVETFALMQIRLTGRIRYSPAALISISEIDDIWILLLRS